MVYQTYFSHHVARDFSSIEPAAGVEILEPKYTPIPYEIYLGTSAPRALQSDASEISSAAQEAQDLNTRSY